jgi:hypothetical protein
MAINSVSSSSAAEQQMQVARAQMEAKAARTDENAKSREIEPPQRMEAPERTERTPENREEPKPVVNAQGQKTGTIINTTA